MQPSRFALLFAIAAGFLAPSALARQAKDEKKPDAPAAAPAADVAPDPELDALLKLTAGAYADGSKWLHLAEVRVNGAPRTLLAEITTEGHEDKPEAHVLLQFMRRRGEPYLRLFRFPGGGTIAPGLWMAPKAFPEAEGSRLDVLTDLPIVSDSKTAPTKFSAKTSAPIPTLTTGAVEMTSEISVDANGLALVEHGFDASGTEVWQFPQGKPGMFKRMTGVAAGNVEKRPSGLYISILKEGAADAKVSQPLDEFKLHYIGWLPSGPIFDTSRQENRQPYSLTIPGGVIAAWNEGLIGMKVGETRRLIVPPDLGYGARGYQGIIPPNSWLVFDVELLELKKPEAAAPAPAPAAKPADKPKN